MTESQKAWNLLTEACGNYSGSGINHEGQNYLSEFSLKFAFEKKLMVLTSKATGENGEIFHQEYTTIGFDISGTLNMYVISNNHQGITAHPFNRIEKGSQEEKKMAFRFGEIENKNSFREEVYICLYPTGQLEHSYAWGLPGGIFEPRSGAKMHWVK